ncbi:SDR family oxidoreductase [Rheinheimera sp. 1928-s]|uniref:SDR family oxidoreductase n=1 Tax=Rheinheimera sp. 1928-s TaxID=3033803 RepID=UPI0026163EDD|nr:SDR family oxidoreductase [Rheinheimera sp. 1928-s]MDF3125071.1 SDR family oxidoreductase [Rheinheimera sp. 1928-s]
MSQKIALITGASRGLGKNAALALAKAGVDLVLTYHSKADEAAAVVAEVQQLGRKAVAIQLDTSNVSSFTDFSAQLTTHLQHIWQRDQFDFLVNNAGFGIYATLAETTEQQFDALMNVHLKGVFFLTQQLLPQIADGGRILNYSSGLTRFSLPGYGAYAAMKGAIEVLSRYLALESGARGIRVNTLAPGAIETDFGGGAVRDNADINHYIASQTALGRVGLPDDIGGVVQMLLSEQSGWINGQRIEVSGGIHL